MQTISAKQYSSLKPWLQTHVLVWPHLIQKFKDTHSEKENCLWIAGLWKTTTHLLASRVEACWSTDKSGLVSRVGMWLVDVPLEGLIGGVDTVIGDHHIPLHSSYLYTDVPRVTLEGLIEGSGQQLVVIITPSQSSHLYNDVPRVTLEGLIEGSGQQLVVIITLPHTALIYTMMCQESHWRGSLKGVDSSWWWSSHSLTQLSSIQWCAKSHTGGAHWRE